MNDRLKEIRERHLLRSKANVQTALNGMTVEACLDEAHKHCGELLTMIDARDEKLETSHNCEKALAVNAGEWKERAETAEEKLEKVRWLPEKWNTRYHYEQLGDDDWKHGRKDAFCTAANELQAILENEDELDDALK